MILSLYELCKRVDRETEQLKKLIENGKKVWGKWVYHPADDSYDKCLEFDGHYGIALHRVSSAGDMGELLLHLSDKKWGTNKNLGDLIRALMDLQSVGFHSISRKGVM